MGRVRTKTVKRTARLIVEKSARAGLRRRGATSGFRAGAASAARTEGFRKRIPATGPVPLSTAPGPEGGPAAPPHPPHPTRTHRRCFVCFCLLMFFCFLDAIARREDAAGGELLLCGHAGEGDGGVVEHRVGERLGGADARAEADPGEDVPGIREDGRGRVR